MVQKKLIALSLLSLSAPLFAQSTCSAFNDAVELQLKKAAQNWVAGVGDNSAPRATLRELETSNALALARMNLDLATLNKCPVRTKPLNPMIYMGEALDCNLQTLKGVKDSPACKMQDWEGLGSSADQKASEG